jgi:uncharacterized RDD family membrane protein YckC
MSRAVIRIRTPEAVTLNLEPSIWHARLVAFVVDAILVAVVAGGLSLLSDQLFGEDPTVAASVRALVVFVVTKAWFIRFELAWNGQTPGKRLLGIRVVMRDGGRLDTGGIVIRNIARDLETLLPFVAVVSPSSLGLDGDPRMILFWIWLVGLTFLPLMNPLRLRFGDILGRTVVVTDPRAVLLPDLTAQASGATEADPTDDREAYVFTAAQLSIYGPEELHVLEDVLRFHGAESGGPGLALPVVVARRIAARIGWRAHETPSGDDVLEGAEAVRFLRSFYKAQRDHLERDLLHGRRARHG